MAYCSECGKKETKKLFISPINNKCTTCIAKSKDYAESTNGAAVDNSQETTIDDECSMGVLKFSTFKRWFNVQVERRIKEEVDDVVRTRILPINSEINDLKKELNSAKKELTDAANKVTSLEQELNSLKSSVGNQEIVGNNNLKYLIHYDRKVRKHNLLIMGLDENHPLTINDLSADDDKQKAKLIANFLCPDIVTNISDCFSLGKAIDHGDDDGRTRPGAY